jgi:mono/diheme cytochrome c family protein
MGQRARSRWAGGVVVAVIFATSISTLIADDSSQTPWVAPARAARKKNPVPADAKSVAAGKDVYVAQCLKCHGDAGKGDGPSAKDLDPKPKDLSDPKIAGQTDGSMFWKITTGRKPMPGFENLISEDDRWNVINYTRTLEPSAATQPGSQK